MKRRSYGQFCSLALALDRIGDRWTLLIARELVLGPRRYSEIADALPGIATNLLSGRLKRLERDGIVVRRRTPSSRDPAVYELTDVGRELEESLLPLVRWGRHFLPRRRGRRVFRAHWLGLSMRALIPPERVRRLRGTAELRVDGEVIHLSSSGRRLRVERGPAPAPDVVLAVAPDTLFAIGRGHMTLRQAADAGLASVTGNVRAVEGLARMLSPTAGSGRAPR